MKTSEKVFGYSVFLINLLITLSVGISIGYISGLLSPIFLIPLFLTALSIVCIIQIRKSTVDLSGKYSIYRWMLIVNAILISALILYVLAGLLFVSG